MSILNQKCENVDEIIARLNDQIKYVRLEFPNSFDEDSDENCLEELNAIMDLMEEFKAKQTVDSLLNVEDDIIRLTYCADNCRHIVLGDGNKNRVKITREMYKHLGFTDAQIDEWIEDLK